VRSSPAQGLSPRGVPSPGLHLALHTADLIRSCARTWLTAVSHKPRRPGSRGLLEELERWRTWQPGECYLERLGSLGLVDKVPEHDPVRRTRVPRGSERIIVCAVPDPPVEPSGLEGLAARMPVLVLVHARSPLADHFDGWGRPLAARWRNPHCRAGRRGNIHLSGSLGPRAPNHGADRAEAERFGPADIASAFRQPG